MRAPPRGQPGGTLCAWPWGVYMHIRGVQGHCCAGARLHFQGRTRTGGCHEQRQLIVMTGMRDDTPLRMQGFSYARAHCCARYD